MVNHPTLTNLIKRVSYRQGQRLISWLVPDPSELTPGKTGLEALYNPATHFPLPDELTKAQWGKEHRIKIPEFVTYTVLGVTGSDEMEEILRCISGRGCGAKVGVYGGL